MKKLTLLLIAMLSITALNAQKYGEDLTVKLWDNSTAPHSNNLTGGESEAKALRIGNITEAELYIFKAEPSVATQQAVVICPGGGYSIVSMDNEGYLMAEWFAQQGVTAAVLKYRMPNGVPEVPIEDATKAIAELRAMSAELGIDPQKVGIVGSSAGGHLAAAASTIPSSEARPNFTVLFYPVITGEMITTHQGSYNNLLGRDRTQSLTEEYSLDKRVDAQTPPAFLVHCNDDKIVPSLSSIRYYEALHRAGVKASLHIYPSGGHGWGAYDTFKYRAEWRSALADWLQTIDK